MISRLLILFVPILLASLKKMRPRGFKQQIALILIIGALGYLNEEFGRYSVFSDRVIDGDTFVMDREKIRIWGIDTPERGEFGYDQATQKLTQLVDKDDLSCVLKKRDVYRRALMQCRMNNGDDLGATMVASGWAKDFTKYSNDYYRIEESQAKRQGLGLWR